MQLNSIIVMDVVAYGGAALGIIAVLREFAAWHGFFRRHRYHDFAFRRILYPHAPAGLFFHIAMNGMAASDRLFAILDLEEGKAGEECLAGWPCVCHIPRCVLFLRRGEADSGSGVFSASGEWTHLPGGNLRLWKEYHCRPAHRPESGLSRNDPDWRKGIVPDSGGQPAVPRDNGVPQ